MRYTANTRESPKAAMLGVFGAVGIALGIALALLLAVVAPASAQSVCATHAEVVKHLDSRYSQAPVAMGLANNGGVVEVFSTGNGSTWTFVLTMPDGQSCAMVTGQGWESLPPLALGPQA